MNIMADAITVACNWPGCNKSNCQFPGGKPKGSGGSKGGKK